MPTRTVHSAVLLAALALLLSAAPSRAGETAETVLIRQALERDRSGLRRGDAELVTSALAGSFVHYDARGYADPAGWTVAHEDAEAYSDFQAEDLASWRYDIRRTVSHLHVYLDKAYATTVDSGWVEERASERRQPYARTSLWTFRKLDEEWLATALVSDLGDSTAGPYDGPLQPVPEALGRVLNEEASGWSDDRPGAVLEHFDEEAVIFDSYGSSNPAKPVIVFADAEEFEEWLDERLRLVDYRLERQLSSAQMGPEGSEAIAIADEALSVAYELGNAASSLQRRVVWTLSRRSGSWKVTNAFLHVKSWQ